LDVYLPSIHHCERTIQQDDGSFQEINQITANQL